MKTSVNRNVLGTEMQACCYAPKTGFYRDDFCRTGPEDVGTHVVCAVMTEEFLVYTKTQGNDLSTPIPIYQFPGLKPGDKWCLCASRWKQAYKVGKAPEVILEATHEKALQIVAFEWLLEHKYIPNN
ncbi:MAG: DUF2237 domain-containing protein [Bacteroidota bacterium]